MAMILIMIANYFHDLAVAMLAANVLAITFVGRHFDKHPQRDAIVSAFFSKLSRLNYVILAYVLAGGALRAYFFMDAEWNPALGREQISALILKHILLLGLTAFGLVAQNHYRKKYRYND